jgi:hypothetical protein
LGCVWIDFVLGELSLVCVLEQSGVRLRQILESELWFRGLGQILFRVGD